MGLHCGKKIFPNIKFDRLQLIYAFLCQYHFPLSNFLLEANTLLMFYMTRLHNTPKLLKIQGRYTQIQNQVSYRIQINTFPLHQKVIGSVYWGSVILPIPSLEETFVWNWRIPSIMHCCKFSFNFKGYFTIKKFP